MNDEDFAVVNITFHIKIAECMPDKLRLKCALSDEGEVGVDIEVVKPRKEGLPRYVMSEEELAAFDGTWEDFTRIWTLKEALVKYRGTSVAKARAVTVPPDVPYRSYEGEGWRAALCCEGEPPAEINWVEV